MHLSVCICLDVCYQYSYKYLEIDASYRLTSKSDFLDLKLLKEFEIQKSGSGPTFLRVNSNDTFSSFPPFSFFFFFFFFFFFRRYELPWLFPLCTSLIFRQRLLPWLKNCSVSRPTLPLLSLTSRFSLQLILTRLRSVYTCVLSCLNPEQHAGTL